jgi:hypothetical protein
MSYPPPPNQPDPYQPGQPYDPQQSGPPSYGPPVSGQPGYPGHQPQPYGGGYPGYPQQRRTNVMAIVALALAIFVPPVSIVLGHIAKKQIRTSGEEGAGLATAGLVIGYVLTALYVLGCCGAIALGYFSSTVSNDGGAVTGY